ncbi:MAG: nucleotidyl transferase AbiEii/AbiGii toxin family protein [bacterium]
MSKVNAVKTAYLAGGTACALRIGHRYSFDLDFFTGKKFRTKSALRDLSKIKFFNPDRTAWGTVLGKFKSIKFSLFYYEYPLLAPSEVYRGVRIAVLKDIAAMKIAAIADRGTKRDFVDLYFMGQEGISIEKAVELYGKKYQNLSSTLPHILKSITYFDDAEKDKMPEMLKKISWVKIKKYFMDEAKKTAKKFLEKHRKKGK